MHTTPPLVSICIPVYNTEAFIGEAVMSALSQTLVNLEVVVVDNASTDGTLDIVHAIRDPRLRVLSNGVNIGAVGNFNRALAEARGTYVKLLCADDLVYPDCLARQVDEFEGTGGRDLALVSCARDIIDGKGRRWATRGAEPSQRLGGPEAIRKCVRRGTNLFGEPGAVLMRTESVRSSGGFDSRYRYCVDFDLWCRLVRTGAVSFMEEALCAFRISDQSWSLALSGTHYSEFSAFIAERAARRDPPLSRTDLAVGRGRAYVNAITRAIFIQSIIAGTRWIR